MKSFRNLVLGMMTMSSVLVGCKDDDPKGPVTVVEDGFYVVGAATAVADLLANDASKGLMAAGINEAGGAVRTGMYEKYVALEGGKTFSLILKEGDKETKYGATLADADLSEIDEQPETAQKGVLTSGGADMQVTTNGLYHIVIDLNKDNKLDGPVIYVTPVKWGIRGHLNSWGFTALTAPTFNKTTMTYTLSNVKASSSGEYKFAYSSGWKIFLNGSDDDVVETNRVRVNTNLGNDGGANGGNLTAKLLPGGPNIGIARGIYTIKLTWTLAKGAVKEGYVAEMTKTGDPEMNNYSNCEVELVGSGVDESNSGAQPDVVWGGWGHVVSAGKPVKDGNVYTWTWNSVTLKAEGFKIRTINAQPSGGIDGFDLGFGAVDAGASPDVVEDGGNIKATEAGSYKIVLIIDAAAEAAEEANARKVVITKL